MKPTIVTIDGLAFLLPDNKGLQTLLSLCAGAVRLTRRQYITEEQGGPAYQWTVGDELQVDTETVGKKTRFITEEGVVVDVRTGKPAPAPALKPLKEIKRLSGPHQLISGSQELQIAEELRS